MEVKLSKTLSYLLRHHPGEGNLEMDPQGFVNLDSLLSELSSRGWSELDRESLAEKLDDPDVERFERRDSAVRATYGHSVDVNPEYPKIQPEFPLYHGTTPEAWSTIREEGLKPMNRQYVHLSRNVPEARRVGSRRTSSPVVLQVEPENGGDREFFRAGPVVLTTSVPGNWIEVYES